MTMTSLPIMYYAIFDFEYEKTPPLEKPRSSRSKKKYLMEDSSLYDIGLKSVCLNEKLFIKWIAYALS